MNTHTLIVGLGKTGLSCAKFLVQRGINVTVTDTRNNPPGLIALRTEVPQATLALGGFQEQVFGTAQQIILSPGVPIAEPLIQKAIQRGVTVIGDIELFAQEINQQPAATRAQIIAVTGSNGKSTVVSLLAAMAHTAGWKYAIGGNFGEPALNLLNPECKLYILELSSFQLETTYSLAPVAACVLNISPDHMDRYPNIETYAQAKARIYLNAKNSVFNRDDSQVQAMSKILHESIGFTIKSPTANDYGIIQTADETWLAYGKEPLLPTSALQIPGNHNLTNALAALALGNAAGLPMPAMLTALSQYTGLPHRTQLITIRNGIRWYNDSKGTNVGATIAALEGLHSPTNNAKAILIAGGDCKKADFTALAPVVAYTCRAVILIGRDAPIIEQALSGREGNATLVRAVNIAQSIEIADKLAKAGDHVLLSPACASFDMFRNYEHRGEVFAELVRGLKS